MQQSLADEAMALVRRLEESGALGAGGRLPALLRYLVQEELAGRGDRLKAYSIATEVLGRGQSFDPQQDSIVRVEIGRLRKALDIPRGASRPKISVENLTQGVEEDPDAVAPRADTPGRRRFPVALASTILVLAVCLSLFFAFGRRASAPVAFTGAVPRLILLPVQTEGADPDLRALALGLRAQLAAELAQQKWLTVSLLDGLTPPPPAEPKLFAAAPVLIKDASSYVLSAQLTSEPDHTVRWSGQYRNARLHDPLYDLASQLAAQLARDLGYPLGPIGQAVAGRSSATDAEVEDRFFCMMNAYRYWRDLEPKQAADASTCLTRLTARAPDFAEGRAALALITIEQGKKLDGEDRKAAFANAAALLRGAPDDDRLSLLAKTALSACSGDVEATKGFARSLQAAAPNDPDSLAAAAQAAGLAALDWPFALELEARALKLAKEAKPIYSQVSAAKALMQGDYEGALRAISRTTQQGHVLGQTMLLIIAQLANAPVRAEGAAAALAKLKIGDAEALKATIARACWHPDVKLAFENALARANGKPPP